MLRLQEKRNKHEENIEAACAEQLKIKRECIELEKNIAKKRSQKVQTTEEKWDDEKCNQAVQLFNQGMEYPTIAKKKWDVM
jgi:hypothetical protein